MKISILKHKDYSTYNFQVLDEISTVFDSCDKSIESGAMEQNLFAETEIAVGSLINTFIFGYRFHGEKRSEFFHLKVSLKQFNLFMESF